MNDQNELNQNAVAPTTLAANSSSANSGTANSGNWPSENVRALRLRLGFSAADLARRLGCECEKVRAWEIGLSRPEENEVHGLELLNRQAEAISEELAHRPVLDQLFDHGGVSQIDMSQIDLSQIDLLDLKR